MRIRNVGYKTILEFKEGGRYEGQATIFLNGIKKGLIINSYDAKELYQQMKSKRPYSKYFSDKLRDGTIEGYKFSEPGGSGPVWFERTSIMHAINQGII